MNRIRYGRFLAIFGTIIVLNFTFFTFAATQDSHMVLQKGNVHPKMAGSLVELEKEYKKGAIAAQVFAQRKNIKIDNQNQITAYLLSERETTVNEMSLKALGAEIIKSADNVSKIKAPINMLRIIADNVKGVSFIKLPDKPIPVAESEGVDLSGASAYHSAGYTGSGVKVAIIDSGFAGLSAAISDGELPNNVVKVNCTGPSCVSTNFNSETEEHGTAVAEIVYDMAPGAKLYLIKVADTLDLLDAKNYAIVNGIEIINHSLVWANINFYDGKWWHISDPVYIANNAHANGILWVNAAGNGATKHYEATFTDSDNDGWHNISGSDESINISANAGDSIKVYLTWNAWPTTNQDYDLALYYGSNLVEQSIDRQTGTQEPTEEINYLVPATGTYYLWIKKYSATSNHQLEVYSISHELTPAVASSSLLNPSDATGAMAVGAIDHDDWTTGPQESFSSQGPSNDGRIKPDICGPDNVSSYVFGSFSGTSVSCAHVSGAAALILSKNPICSVSELWNALISSAIDMGSVVGKDNIYGYGRLNLDQDSGSGCVGFVGFDGGGSGGGGGGCFIDSAAYGSPMEP